MSSEKIFFTIMLAQAGAIRWYVDRVGYLSKRMIFFENSDLKLIESPCICHITVLKHFSIFDNFKEQQKKHYIQGEKINPKSAFLKNILDFY